MEFQKKSPYDSKNQKVHALGPHLAKCIQFIVIKAFLSNADL